jgi:hypothetical protein
METYIHTDRQTGDLISLLSFLESKLIMIGGKARGKDPLGRPRIRWDVGEIGWGC